MRFEFLAVLYGLAAALPTFAVDYDAAAALALASASSVAAPARVAALTVPAYDRYDWRACWDRNNALGLFYDGTQIGAYDFANGVFTAMVAGRWIGPRPIPNDAPPLPPDPSRVYYGSGPVGVPPPAPAVQDTSGYYLRPTAGYYLFNTTRGRSSDGSCSSGRCR